jgi:hypothetical protein
MLARPCIARRDGDRSVEQQRAGREELRRRRLRRQCVARLRRGGDLPVGRRRLAVIGLRLRLSVILPGTGRGYPGIVRIIKALVVIPGGQSSPKRAAGSTWGSTPPQPSPCATVMRVTAPACEPVGSLLDRGSGATRDPPPVSYATTTYFGVNSFKFVNENSAVTIGRYQLLPGAVRNAVGIWWQDLR